MPPISGKTFNIPFSGGAATVVCLYIIQVGTASNTYGSTSVQYNVDGTTVSFEGSGDPTLSVSVNNDVMTVTLRFDPVIIITDARCCLIPGDPFA